MSGSNELRGCVEVRGRGRQSLVWRNNPSFRVIPLTWKRDALEVCGRRGGGR